MLRALIAALALSNAAHASTPGDPTTWTPDPQSGIVQSNPEGQWIVKRVAGDLVAAVTQSGIIYRIGPSAIDTELPHAYPIPTAPGAIEIKRYPAIRRAEYTTPMQDPAMSNRAGNNGFWPLFRHIDSRGIPMTSPVELDYHGLTLDNPEGLRSMTMSFLYRTLEEGKIETDGKVEVVDVPAVTVISVGIRGVFSGQMLERELQTLRAWLDTQTEWRAAGHVRVFQYNGPSTMPANRWVEVQVPIEPVPAAADPAPPTAEPEPSAPQAPTR